MKDLGDIFVVATEGDPTDTPQVFLSKRLASILDQLLLTGYPSDEDLKAGEALANAINQFVLLSRGQRPMSPNHLIVIPDDEIYKLAGDLLEEKRALWTEAGELFAILSPLRQCILRGSKDERAEASGRMQKLFGHAARRWSQPWTPAPVKSGSWTCNYKRWKTSDIQRVPLEVALIEGAFILTQKSVEAGRTELPTKSQLWDWMKQEVLGEVGLKSHLMAEFLRRSGLSALPRSRSWTKG